MKPGSIHLTVGILLICCFTALAAGIDGKWTGQVAGQQGQMDVTFVFKSDGEKLTGTYTNSFGEATLTDGTIKGNDIAFKVTRELNGNKFVLKFTGKMAGDEIKLTRAFDGEGPGGQTPPPPVDFTIKRAK